MLMNEMNRQRQMITDGEKVLAGRKADVSVMDVPGQKSSGELETIINPKLRTV